MTSSESLIRAAFNRLRARMGNSLLSSISKTEVLFKEGPDLIEREWNIFKEEIIEEANRIDQQESKDDSLQKMSDGNEISSNSQSKISEIRKKVANLTKQIEALN